MTSNNQELIRSTAQALLTGGHTLSSVPVLLARIIDEDIWLDREINGKKVDYKVTEFRRFIEDYYPQGLNTTIETIEALCQHEPKIMDYVAMAKKGVRGGQIGNTNAGKLKVRPDGRMVEDGKTNHQNLINRLHPNSTQAHMNRLRDNRPDLHTKVINKEMSINSAMLEAGFKKKRITISTQNIESMTNTIFNNLEVEQIQALIIDMISRMSSSGDSEALSIALSDISAEIERAMLKIEVKN